MAWYSLLPPHLTAFETWIVRFFILCGFLTIGPWAFLVLFDIVLYIFRLATYEIPIVGGRARGRLWPRAPSLTERPSGRRRAFSLRGEEPVKKDKNDDDNTRPSAGSSGDSGSVNSGRVEKTPRSE
ncbi:hypothetical protein VTN96DRAFT_1901 [Rasamsonia emersonii]